MQLKSACGGPFCEARGFALFEGCPLFVARVLSLLIHYIDPLANGNDYRRQSPATRQPRFLFLRHARHICCDNCRESASIWPRSLGNPLVLRNCQRVLAKTSCRQGGIFGPNTLTWLIYTKLLSSLAKTSLDSMMNS